MATALDVLKLAREKISHPENWCKGNYAQDGSGRPVLVVYGHSVAKWCALGAIMSAEYDLGCRGSLAAKTLASAIHPYENIGLFNDRSNHAEVIQAFDCAIDIADIVGQGKATLG